MSESTFTIHNYSIPIKTLGEPIYLIPFGDIHRNAPLCHVPKWLEFLEWAKTKEQCYFIGMGDYNDMASGSERMILSSRALHESTAERLDRLYREDTDILVRELSFMKGRIIGLMEGNHHGELRNATTTTQYMAGELECRYLGISSFIRLNFHMKKLHLSKSVDIWVHHGAGGGSTIGGSINSVQKMLNVARADMYFMGHDHKKWAAMVDTLQLEGKKHLELRHKKILMARTGSFLKGYEPGEESYVAKAGMQPSNLGVVKIEMTPRRQQTDNRTRFTIDLHVSI